MIDKNKLYKTSSFCFIQPDYVDSIILNIATGERFKKIKKSVYDILFYFLNEKTINSAVADGFSEEFILFLISKDFLLESSKSIEPAIKLWEDHNWGRAAYLNFSQINLIYYEKSPEILDQNNLTSQRRRLMSDYQKEEAYPKRFKSITDNKEKEIYIPIKQKLELSFDVLKKRSCVRHFNNNKVSFSDFCDTLSMATQDIRVAEKSRSGGDDFFLPNSYYSWTVIYVLVQGVEGLDRGVYQYDPEKSKLMLIREKVSDDEISVCIQNQGWIKGGGFSLFIGSHWDRYSWIYRHSRAYINLLIQLGELSQEFIVAAYSHGLSGWMTPAVTESKANELCGILNNDNVDIIYFMKFGKNNYEL